MEQRTAATLDPYLYRIRDLISRASGIFVTDNKFYFLQHRCERRLQAVGARSFGEYYQYLTAGPNRGPELLRLLNEITVGETCFFRYPEQVVALCRGVLPSLANVKSRQVLRRFRIWSAGCSTGEEPYTLAMALTEQMQGALRGWSFEISATDLNENSLAIAKEGIYDDYALRNIPAYFKQKYFRRQGNRFQVADEVKAHVSFSRLNLREDWQMVFMKGMDTIFCCNVMIYFDHDFKRRVIQHFYNSLQPDGSFFTGHADSLVGINDNFRLVRLPGAVAYQKLVSKPGAIGGM